jgi:acetoacetyl-CoA synthetase
MTLGEAPKEDDPSPPIWTPKEADVANSQIARFGEYVAAIYNAKTATYLELWDWSVSHIEEFWSAISEFFDIRSGTDYGEVLTGTVMPDVHWFEGATLNYAEHALRFCAGPEAALIAISEDGSTTSSSWDDLRAEVGALGHWLRASGVRRGDRVVGYLPSGRHAVVAFLATASLGAVWSACGQDLGAPGAAARFSQLDPVVLIAANGYRWNGETHDRTEQARELKKLLPTVRATISVPHIGPTHADDDDVTWEEATSTPAGPIFESVGFADPLWVLFSSGTTGPPKGIVHGHGGVLLEHHKMLGLHLDLKAFDPFFWYTNTNWMMWNVVVSGLLVGATIVVYDGSPSYPHARQLFDLAATHRVKVLGVSPGYLLNCEKAGIDPRRDLDLSPLRVLASTGSPLPASSYPWVREHVGREVQLDSTSGGTDVVSAFAGSAPTTPVWAGEVSAPMLGVALEAWDPEGRVLVDAVGELVITKPMPSMPIYFWNDPDSSRYRESYFDTFPGVWRQGDWITQTARGSVVFSGRSDSTLNRQGVRLGSADIYEVVENLPEIREALVIGAELADGAYWMPLFVVMEPGSALDDATRERIVSSIRADASPRHVPDEIWEVPSIPHTRTGKKLEIPVKRILQGTAVERATSPDAVDDIGALSYFAKFSPPEKK